MKSLPCQPLRISHPVLVGSRVATMRCLLSQHRLPRRVEPIVNCLQFAARIDLYTEVVKAWFCAPCRDRKIDARVFKRPLRVVRLGYTRLRIEQLRIKPDALLEITDRHMYMHALHFLLLFLLFRGLPPAALRRGKVARVD